MDIKLQAYVRRLKAKGSDRPPATQLATAQTGQQISGAVKAIVGSYNPDTDRLEGTLPTGEVVQMESLTSGSVGLGQSVIYEAGYYNSMPAR